MAADSESFRAAMSRVGASIHVVTVGGGADRTGTTATALCSVSDSPPTILVCLNKNSLTGKRIRDAGVFGVSTLIKGQEQISNIFAGRTGAKGKDKFVAGQWDDTAGAPLLRDAAVALQCDVTDVNEVASHFVIFGLVKSVRLGPHGAALIYYQRRYHHVDQHSAALA